jgi:phosphoribosylanthranilate isomerase
MSTPGDAEGPRRTRVKICGLTRLEDARAALDAGADWLGFIVAGESPRRIEPAAAGAIVGALPGATAVAVMVAVTPDQALRLARSAGAARVQLHRTDPAGWPADFPLPVTFVVPVRADGRLQAPLPPDHSLLMLDAHDPVLAGGTGATLPWATAATLAASRDLVLAGGLDPDNVERAIEQVRPWAVDASSRLERAPGLKDHERVRRFVAAVRRADAVRA